MANLESRISRLERAVSKKAKTILSSWFLPAVITYRTKAELIEAMQWYK